MRACFLAVALTSVGCSVLVDPTTEIRCDVETGCPDGRVCEPLAVGASEGVCRERCMPPGMPEECNRRDDDCDGMVDEGLDVVAELCNAMDDDCDGRIDEGNDLNDDGTIDPSESFDRDDDGYNQCGTDRCLDPDSECTFNADRIDCNDEDAAINPAANEECDATDHNCDSLSVPSDLSELDARCASIAPGTICEPSLGCVPDDCSAPRNACSDDLLCDTTQDPPRCVMADCSPAACRMVGQWCDPMSGECRPRAENGTVCSVDEQCRSLVCLEPGAVRLPSSIGAKICMEACCTDDDCPAGQFCWDGGNGARTCLPVDVGSSTTGRTALGSAGPDAPCDEGPDCRSGRCENDRCLSPCRHDSHCDAGQSCSLHEVRVAGSDRAVLACASGRNEAESGCSTALDCQDLCCDVILDTIFGKEVDCSRDSPWFDNECVATTFCATDADCGERCSYLPQPPNLARGVVAACTGGERSGACCNSRQCGAEAVCRPFLGTGGGENWLMFCSPKPF